jgi:hypothetical protein
MTRPLPLACHPDTPCTALRGIVALARRGGDGRLDLTFTLDGDIAALRVPPPAPARRVPDLWQHTCLEAFVAVEGSPSYLELNLAPSGEWAAWHFDDYRAGMRDADIPAPRIEARAAGGSLVLRARVDLAALPSLAAAGEWRLGLTAVIEPRVGATSYWALAHPAGKPDFHARGGWTCVLHGKLDR